MRVLTRGRCACGREMYAKNIERHRQRMHQHDTFELPPAGRLVVDGDLLQCHVCANWYRALGIHAYRMHGLTADDYRQEFHLPHGTRSFHAVLAGEATRRLYSEFQRQRFTDVEWRNKSRERMRAVWAMWAVIQRERSA